MAARKKGKRKDYGVSDEKFILIWQTSSSIDEVAQKTGMPAAICHARASFYRRKQVKLKAMPRKSTRGLDVEKMNRIIEQIPPVGNGNADKVIRETLKRLEKDK